MRCEVLTAANIKTLGVLGCGTLQSRVWFPAFQRNELPPSSVLKGVKQKRWLDVWKKGE
jgi:hypothetical protein